MERTKPSNIFWCTYQGQTFEYVYLYCENNYCGGILLCIESREARLEHQGDGAMKKLTWGIQTVDGFTSSTDSVCVLMSCQMRQN